MTRSKSRIRAGFTLIELLIVMSIIGILAALLFANFASLRERARDSKRKTDLDQVKNALRLYYNDWQSYPGSSATNQINGCGASSTSTCVWGTSFTGGSTVYMSELPKDPLSTGAYKYTLVANTSAESFLLTAELENKGDPDIVASQTKCGSGVGVVTTQTYEVCN